MALKNFQGQGPNWVGSYQTAGTPYVTSSNATGTTAGPNRIQFPYVTKTLTVRNHGAVDLRVAFSMSGSYAVGETVKGGQTKPQSSATNDQGNNFFTLPAIAATVAPSQVTLDVRCKEIFLMSAHSTTVTAYSLYAGLTGISTDQFPVLSASNEFKGIG